MEPTELLIRIATLANEAKDPNQTIQVSLDMVCRYLNWPIGHAFLIDEDQKQIISTGIWSVSSDNLQFSEFKTQTEKMSFSFGEGVPGLVLSKKEAVWKTDIDTSKEFLRKELANQIGIKTCLAVPVLVGNKVLAVLEFFASQKIEEDPLLINFMPHIGMQIGRVIERKQAEDIILESRQNLNNVLENITDSFYALNSDFKFTYLNSKAEKFFEIQQEQLKGKSIWTAIPEFRGTIFEEKFTAALKEQKSKIFETISPGTERWIEVHAYPSPKGVSVFFHDVHERVVLSNRLERLRLDLARSNKDLEQFAYVASHDLREPLREVTSFAQLLQKKYSGQIDEKADKYLNYMIVAVYKMDGLIKSLLTFSRVGRTKIEEAPVDMNQIAQDVLNMLSRQINENNVQIEVNKLPIIKGNDMLILQVLQNLISNSIKYKREVPPEITITSDEGPDNWTFHIQDNGLGIDPSQKDRIFGLFQRGTTPHKIEGSGVGLAISKKIVERHGGNIWFDSTPGEGSIFSFSIPKHFVIQEVENERNAHGSLLTQ